MPSERLFRPDHPPACTRAYCTEDRLARIRPRGQPPQPPKEQHKPKRVPVGESPPKSAPPPGPKRKPARPAPRPTGKGPPIRPPTQRGWKGPRRPRKRGKRSPFAWLLIVIGLLSLGFGLWHAGSEGLFDSATWDLGKLTEPRPTPTPPAVWEADRERAEDQIWDDRWVSLTTKPQVCDGVLRFSGQAENGASVSYQSTDTLPFVLYLRSELAPKSYFTGGDVVEPIAGLLQPPSSNSYYPDLDPTDIVATSAQTGPDGFTVVADWPAWLPEPEKVALGVWGFRPGHGEDGIRLIRVDDCE